jgi:hypothetical protein
MPRYPPRALSTNTAPVDPVKLVPNSPSASSLGSRKVVEDVGCTTLRRWSGKRRIARFDDQLPPLSSELETLATGPPALHCVKVVAATMVTVATVGLVDSSSLLLAAVERTR